MASQAIGIDIGAHAIKVAVLQKKGPVTRAVRLYRAKLGGDTDMERVRGALMRAGISGGPGVLGITGRDLIIRYTHVPPVPDWRLKLLMQFEINEVSGQSGGEVAADYVRLTLPVDTGEDTVLVALCRNTWLQPRLDAASAGGMKAAGGCPNSVALCNAFLAHGKLHDDETTYLVNLGRDNIDMAVQRDGELLFARNMAGGGHMFTESIMQAFGLKEGKAEANKVKKGDLTPKGQARYPDSTSEKLANAMQGPAGQLVSMIQSTVMICRAQTKLSDLNIDRLLLTGGGARMKGIRDYFQQAMSVPVEIFDPVDDLDTSGLHPDDAGELDEPALDFAVAVGLAETLLQPTSKKLEVLTESAKKKRHFVERTIWNLAAVAATLALVVMLFKTRGADIERTRADNEKLGAQLNSLNKQADLGEKWKEAERRARQKDVTLRSRRIAGEFTRAILQMLQDNHPKKFFYLRDVRFETDRVDLELDGNPMGSRSGSGFNLTTMERIYNQKVWPKCTVDGVIQKTAPAAGQKLRVYQQQLRAALPEIEGFKVVFEPEGLKANNQFRITFKLEIPPPKKEKKGGKS